MPVQDSNVSDQDPYLYGGKEFYSLKGLNIYDFNARTYAPDIARFLQPDPNASDYHWLSPYAYCGGDPINRVDPDGKDAIILFDGKTFTVKASIILTGNNVNDEVARIYQEDIKKLWGQIKEFSYDGKTYNVNWDIDVSIQKSENIDYNGVNNYMEVITEQVDGRWSYVTHTNHGNIRGVGRDGRDLSDDSPMSHEFGHMLGLSDKYKDHRPISEEWTNDVMAEPTYKAGRTVSKKHAEKLFAPVVGMNNIFDFFRKTILGQYIPEIISYRINNITRAEERLKKK